MLNLDSLILIGALLVSVVGVFCSTSLLLDCLLIYIISQQKKVVPQHSSRKIFTSFRYNIV